MKLKLDLHVHDKESFDSKANLKSIIKIAKKRGLDGIAITNHETLNLNEIKFSKEFIIIKGEEIKTEIGDIIGLFLKKEIKEKEFKKVIQEIKKQGGIVVLPHPAFGHILNNEVLKKIDVIEGINSRIDKNSNEMAQRLAKQTKKPLIAGSDAHLSIEVGNSFTIIESKSKELKDIKQAILKGETKIRRIKVSKIKKIIIKLLKFWRENVN